MAHRILHALNMDVVRNAAPPNAANMPAAEIDIVDLTTGTVREAQLSRHERRLWSLPAEHDDKRASQITVTVAADGSFKEGRARYGMIVLTKALADNYPRLARVKSDKELCDILLTFTANQVFFRLAEMHPNSTKSRATHQRRCRQL